MENIHRTFGEANIYFGIDDLTDEMIRAITSVKFGSHVGYDEYSVIELSDRKCTVLVHATGQRFDFCLP